MKCRTGFMTNNLPISVDEDTRGPRRVVEQRVIALFRIDGGTQCASGGFAGKRRSLPMPCQFQLDHVVLFPCVQLFQNCRLVASLDH